MLLTEALDGQLLVLPRDPRVAVQGAVDALRAMQGGPVSVRVCGANTVAAVVVLHPDRGLAVSLPARGWKQFGIKEEVAGRAHLVRVHFVADTKPPTLLLDAELPAPAAPAPGARQEALVCLVVRGGRHVRNGSTPHDRIRRYHPFDLLHAEHPAAEQPAWLHLATGFTDKRRAVVLAVVRVARVEERRPVVSALPALEQELEVVTMRAAACRSLLELQPPYGNAACKQKGFDDMVSLLTHHRADLERLAEDMEAKAARLRADAAKLGAEKEEFSDPLAFLERQLVSRGLWNASDVAKHGQCYVVVREGGGWGTTLDAVSRPVSSAQAFKAQKPRADDAEEQEQEQEDMPLGLRLVQKQGKAKAKGKQQPAAKAAVKRKVQPSPEPKAKADEARAERSSSGGRSDTDAGSPEAGAKRARHDSPVTASAQGAASDANAGAEVALEKEPHDMEVEPPPADVQPEARPAPPETVHPEELWRGWAARAGPVISGALELRPDVAASLLDACRALGLTTAKAARELADLNRRNDALSAQLQADGAGVAYSAQALGWAAHFAPSLFHRAAQLCYTESPAVAEPQAPAALTRLKEHLAGIVNEHVPRLEQWYQNQKEARDLQARIDALRDGLAERGRAVAQLYAAAAATVTADSGGDAAAKARADAAEAARCLQLSEERGEQVCSWLRAAMRCAQLRRACQTATGACASGFLLQMHAQQARLEAELARVAAAVRECDDAAEEARRADADLEGTQRAVDYLKGRPESSLLALLAEKKGLKVAAAQARWGAEGRLRDAEVSAEVAREALRKTGVQVAEAMAGWRTARSRRWVMERALLLLRRLADRGDPVQAA